MTVRKRFASGNFFEASISLSPNFWFEKKYFQGLYSVIILSRSVYLALNHTADIFPAILWQFRPPPFLFRFHFGFFATFECFVVLEKEIGQEKNTDTQGVGTILMGDKFKGVGVSELVTEEESDIFFCDGGDRTEAEESGIPHWATLTFGG